ncbi:MAG: hypothetical protein PHH60_01970 [Candidatus Margulisbacteria bacterium]|nr:hypothetical protein [Candidatus Margulisiibacteriota bacterium]
MKRLVLLLIAAIMLLAPTGAQALSVGDWGGWPTLGMQFGDKCAGYLGYSNYGGTTSTSWVLAKVDYNLTKLGDVQTKAGIFYWLTSPDAGTQLGLTWGAAIMPVNNLSVGFDIILAERNSNPGADATMDILPGAVFTANLTLF